MYTDELNSLILIALLKKHGIKNIVVSPGGTNDCFALSVQHDPYFTLYSAVDERHAAYLGCGLAAEIGAPVVINCTGATASRNYMSALTEAYYRKLPILAVTCSQVASHLGNMWPQMTNRMSPPADTVRLSVQCPIPRDSVEIRHCELTVNRAILELSRHGGGPVHINLETNYLERLDVMELPSVTMMRRIMPTDETWPTIPKDAKVAVWIGSHRPFSNAEEAALAAFVANHNAVILGDQTSNCHLPQFVLSELVCMQKGLANNEKYSELKPDLIIHLGEISGDYPTPFYLRGMCPVWRVSEDGELRDYLNRLEVVFEMPDRIFLERYSDDSSANDSYLKAWKGAYETIVAGINEDMPFSHLWIAKHLAEKLPDDSELHLGILNQLRCMNVFETKARTRHSNVGGFGIDGNISSLIGASFAKRHRLYVGVVGDLSFFYDLNAIGNRHIGNNVRILVVNNGEGGEFTMPINGFYKVGGEDIRPYIAAKGHFGCKSKSLLKQFVECLGFEYLAASTKAEFHDAVTAFLRDSDRPVIMECFTDATAEAAALAPLMEIDALRKDGRNLKSMVSGILPQRVKNVIKAAIE